MENCGVQPFVSGSVGAFPGRRSVGPIAAGKVHVTSGGLHGAASRETSTTMVFTSTTIEIPVAATEISIVVLVISDVVVCFLCGGRRMSGFALVDAVRLRVCHFAFLALPDSESYKNSYLCCVSHAFSVDADADCPD